VEGDWRAAVAGTVPKDVLRLSNNPRAHAAYTQEREKGYADGFAEGHAEGTNQGRQEGLRLALNQHQSTLDRLARETEELARRLEEAVQRLWLQSEHELRELALAIAECLLKKELSVAPEVIVHVVQNALLRVANSREVRIRVSTADLPALRAAQAQIRELLPADTRIELTSAEIEPGGCIVESVQGVVDASVETQLQQVRDVLHDGEAA